MVNEENNRKEQRTSKEISNQMTLMHNELMTKVFDENIPAAQLLLSIILGRDVEVIMTKGEWIMNNPDQDGRNIRLDIFAKDANGEYFDCEVQQSSPGASPKRARYNSARLDVSMLQEGQPFNAIQDSYMIFITKEDYYKEGKPVYFIDRMRDGKEFFYDGNHILYVNGSYRADDDIGKLMQDMNNATLEGWNYKELEDGVRRFKTYEGGKDNMSELVEEYARERAEERAKEVRKEYTEMFITKLLRKGKDANEVADLLDLDIQQVKTVRDSLAVQ